MTKDETLKIMSILRAAYPRYYANQSKEDAAGAVNLWHIMLSDHDYKTVMMAIRAVIANLKYPPSVADVIASIQSLTAPRDLEPLEAWGLVQKAIRNSLYNADEEFNKLPETIQLAVGSPDALRAWARDDEGATNTVTASNFQRSYAARLKSIKEYRAMPKDVRAFLDSIAETKGLTGNGTNNGIGALPEMRQTD